MHRPGEELLQFIWQHRLLKPGKLVTQSGKALAVIRPGTLNRDAGPDFFNACIKIDGIELAGNIELHVRSSDWLKHGHTHNASYDRLILHVVYEQDTALAQNLDHNVEVLALKDLVAPGTFERYAGLLEGKSRLACAGQLADVDGLRFGSWLERMAIERLEQKVKRLEAYFEEGKGDYVQAFYMLLVRSFGFSVNALPFELAARHLPYTVLLKHSDNLLQLEALLLGICGLLEEGFNDKYMRALQNEFEFLKAKYSLAPLSKSIFKFSRMRPANFPNVRLVQLASVIHSNPRLLLNPVEMELPATIKKQLLVKPAGYWKNHYKMDGNMLDRELGLGEASAEAIIINAFAPFFFFYGKKTGKPELTGTALALLADCAFENNAKTRLFAPKKALLQSGADSQGLIHLYDNYCTPKKCLQCGVGTAILRSASS